MALPVATNCCAFDNRCHCIAYLCPVAIMCMRQLFRGRHIRVDLACGTQTTKDSRLSVFVGNLPFTATEEQVRSG
jgi:hypothetical protein